MFLCNSVLGLNQWQPVLLSGSLNDWFVPFSSRQSLSSNDSWHHSHSAVYLHRWDDLQITLLADCTGHMTPWYIYVKLFNQTRSQVPLSVPFQVVETLVGLQLGEGTRTRIVDHVTRVLSVTLPLYEPELVLVTGGFTGPVVQCRAVCLFSKLAVPPVISAGPSEEELLIATLQHGVCEFDLPHNPEWPIFACVS